MTVQGAVPGEAGISAQGAARVWGGAKRFEFESAGVAQVTDRGRVAGLLRGRAANGLEFNTSERARPPVWVASSVSANLVASA